MNRSLKSLLNAAATETADGSASAHFREVAALPPGEAREGPLRFPRHGASLPAEGPGNASRAPETACGKGGPVLPGEPLWRPIAGRFQKAA